MVSPEEARRLALELPETCEEVWWGKRRAAVRVDLRRVDAENLRELLTDAWETKAPKRLLG